MMINAFDPLFGFWSKAKENSEIRKQSPCFYFDGVAWSGVIKCVRNPRAAIRFLFLFPV